MRTDELKQHRIGVLIGGLSAERDVSLETGQGVVAALQERGYDVVALDWTLDWSPGSSLSELISRSGAVYIWNALHGTYGEDGAVQGLLTCMQIPFTGSGILASALAMDKIASKRIFEECGVPTPQWFVLEAGRDAREQLVQMELPLVVKPANEGSSVGVTIVKDRLQIPAAVAAAEKHSGPTLVERYIAGAELCVGLLDGQLLGTIEVRAADTFYDYDAKYKRDDTEYLIPATAEPAVIEHAQDVALTAYRALGCSGHSRVDLRVSDAGEPFCLEVNTLPGMTSHSLMPKIAAHGGISYAELCERILLSATC